MLEVFGWRFWIRGSDRRRRSSCCFAGGQWLNGEWGHWSEHKYEPLRLCPIQALTSSWGNIHSFVGLSVTKGSGVELIQGGSRFPSLFARFSSMYSLKSFFLLGQCAAKMGRWLSTKESCILFHICRFHARLLPFVVFALFWSQKSRSQLKICPFYISLSKSFPIEVVLLSSSFMHNSWVVDIMSSVCWVFVIHV